MSDNSHNNLIVSSETRIDRQFFNRDVLKVAPSLLGKYIVRRFDNGLIKKYKIIETEAYRGEEDLACHASKGRTPRTEVMYQKGGLVYVYFIYGMYWMLNFVTGIENEPQAVLIRAMEGFNGPGKLTKELALDKSFYGEDLSTSNRIWLAENLNSTSIKTAPRVGINYAGDYWKAQEWRFILEEK
jgi:DNA-3-methyladenine glycosylase